MSVFSARMLRRALVAVLLTVLSIVAISPTFALNRYTANCVTNVTDLGGGKYGLTVDITLAGWTQDATGMFPTDYTGSVYYDKNNQLLGYWPESHYHNYSGPVSWYKLNTAAGAGGPYRVDVYDTTTSPTSSANVLAGVKIGSFMVDVNNFNNCNGAAPVVQVVVEDVDGDGVGATDNCVNSYNPGQEDGWGSDMGDACDTEWYNREGVTVEGFPQKDGSFHLHGNCTFFADGASSCPVIADFDPSTFQPSETPVEITLPEAGEWSVWVYYLHSNNGVDVYQVNVYSTSVQQPDSLLDDRLEIHVSGGSWEWYHRGGDVRYHGI